MGIKIVLNPLLRSRNMTAKELAIAIGITEANLSILNTGKAKAIRFSTLSAICDTLKCQPGDFIQYQDESNDNLF